MTETILIGRGKTFGTQNEDSWRAELAEAVATPSPRLTFMSPEHHLVRDTAVTELARAGAPLTPRRISELVELPERRVGNLLAELEARLFFLTRDGNGAVSWAYPVTTDPTPHALQLSTGEAIFAA